MSADSGPTPLADLLLRLCRTPSPTGEEGPLCDLIASELGHALGPSAVSRDAHSLVVTPRTDIDGPTVVLAGHLDVVRTEHDGPARIDGDKLYGAGAADMKSGLAVMIELARQCAERRPRFRPIFVFYEREEGPYDENRLGELLERFPALREAAFAVCLEPSQNVLQLGCMGSLHARVTFDGRTAHSARPWQGENAIQKAGPFLVRMAAEEPEPCEIEGMRYTQVRSVTLAQGGRGRNVVPDRFELNVNVRFAPGRTADDALRALERLVSGEALVEAVDRSPSALPHRHHPEVAALLRCGARGVEPKQAWTDVARFGLYGVPAVNLGPGTQSQAHQRNEWTDLTDLSAGLGIFERWMFAGP